MGIPSGSITIQEKNLCPETYYGGTLGFIIEFYQSLGKAAMVNGELHIQWPMSSPSGVQGEVIGDRIFHFGEPFPQFGPTLTFHNLFTPAVYMYQMTCYYGNGCPELGPGVALCEWNGPMHITAINLRSNQPVKPTVNISKIRVGQRVFDPSATDGATIDLVTKKPYAVEVTLSATISDESHNAITAKADLYVDGLYQGSSSSFFLGNIVNGQSKAFIFSQEDIPGTKNIEVRVVPVESIPGVFENADAPVSTKTVNFHETSLSLLTIEITGCQPAIEFCFQAPTISERDFYDNQQVPLANKILPISGGGLTVENGLNWSLSTPDPDGDLILIDAAYAWIQKKLMMKDFAVAVVGDDYFFAHGKQAIGEETLGLYMTRRPGVVFVRGEHSSTLTHELLHPLALLGHSSEILVDGVGEGISEVWTNGISLDPAIDLGKWYIKKFKRVRPFWMMSLLTQI